MVWTVHFANASGALDELIEPINCSIEDVRGRAEQVLQPVSIDIVVQNWPSRVIEHLGFVGYAPTGWMMQLTFDSENPNCRAHLHEPLRRTIAHELHHVLRWRGPGYGTTLGEALVSEGLAGQFACQLYGLKPERWEVALNSPSLVQIARMAEASWEAADYDHSAWFFGAGEQPPWAGYSLGYALVGRYLKDNPHATAASSVHENADTFREPLRCLAEACG